MGNLRATAFLLVLTYGAFGQDTAPAVSLEPRVAESEAAAALAAETCRTLDALQYRFNDTGPAGLVLVYAVKRDGEAAGRVELNWVRETNALSCTFPGRRSAEWRKGVADIVRLGFNAALVERIDPEGVYAERRDGDVVLDRTVPETRSSAETRQVLVKVAEDMSGVERIRWFTSGSVRRQTITLAPVEGRTCATRYVSRLIHPDGTLRQWSFEFHYIATRDGLLLPQGVRLDVSRGTQTVKLKLTLAKVQVWPPLETRTNTRTDEPVIPRDEAAARLGRETATRLNTEHFSLIPSDIPGFKATFAVNRAGFRVGDVKATWTRGDALVTADAAPELGEEAGKLVEGLACDGILTALISHWKAPGLYAARQGDSLCLEDLAPGAISDPAMRRAVFQFSEDLLECRIRTWFRDGQESEDRIIREKHGDFAYVATQVQNARPGEPEGVRANWTFRYCHRDDRVFIKRIKVLWETESGSDTWELVLEDVKFVSPVAVVAPDPAGEARAVEVLARAAELHYDLKRAGVKAFDAYYSVHWKGYASGGIRYRWNLAEDQYLVDHEGAVPFAVSNEFMETNDVSFEEWVRVWASSWMWDAVRLFPRPDTALTVRATSNADGTLILYKAKRPETALRLRALVLTPEGLLSSREERYAEGQSVMSVYEQEAVDGEYLRRTTREAVREPDGMTWNRVVNYTYRRTEGVLFPSLIEIRTEPAASTMQITETILTLKELKLVN